MNDALLEAFLGKHFDPAFSQMAVASHAAAALEIDVPDLHWTAGEAVGKIAAAAGDPASNPALRIVLVQGPSGFGKTHRLITKLLDLSRRGQVYPAVMQLSAKVEVDGVSLWMLRKVMDELAASHFADAQRRSPLKRLAEGLWRHAQPDARQEYEDALEVEDLDTAAGAVTKAVPVIRRALDSKGLTRKDGPLIAALMLLADDASSDVDAWLRGGANQCWIGRYQLQPLTEETDRHKLLRDLSRIAMATGAPLVVALDQIESISRLGDERLLAAVVTTAVQLVENTPHGFGLVISALTDTFEHLVSERIDESFRQRIVFGERPVTLDLPRQATVRAVLSRRTAVLLTRAGLPPDPEVSYKFAPDWLLEASRYQTLRDLFQAIRSYRDACGEVGVFLAEHEYRIEPIAPPVQVKDDFEKLWTDMTDADTGAVANFSSYDRERLFLWLCAHVTEELPGITGTSADAYQLSDGAATRMIDLGFQEADGGTVERWKIAFADAPNSRNQLLDQIRSALNAATDAKPALLRDRRMPGVKEDGTPDRGPMDLRKLQLGPALDDLFAAGGRVATTAPKDWQRLHLARQFVEERKDALGFTAWRLERRFLLEHAGIGQMARLVQPEAQVHEPQAHPTQPGRPADLQPNGNGPPRIVTSAGPQITEPSGAGTPGNDPRDHADILIGHGRREAEIRWRLDKDADPALPNFGLYVSGDAGQGKTQAIKAVIAEAARLACPVLVFDFKNDYGGDFAKANGFTVVDLSGGLPFNPLKLPPHGPSGAQAITHIYEVTGILGTSLGLGDQQKALLRQSLQRGFEDLDVDLRDWVDPEATPAPALADIVALAEEIDTRGSNTLLNRLGLLHDLRLLPSAAEARLSFSELLAGRFVLSFNTLPADDKLKGALAELVLIQLQAHMLRGEQPRALRRLLVFDEAWRAARNKHLIQLAREGRAFGVGVVAGSQFADDLSGALTGNLATKLHLYNSDATKRTKLVKAILGSTAGSTASTLTHRLGTLQKFEGIFANQQHQPYAEICVLPYYMR